MIAHVYRSLCKITLLLVRFLLNLNFLAKLSKDTQILIFIKTSPVGTEIFLADKRDEANSEKRVKRMGSST